MPVFSLVLDVLHKATQSVILSSCLPSGLHKCFAETFETACSDVLTLYNDSYDLDSITLPCAMIGSMALSGLSTLFLCRRNPYSLVRKHPFCSYAFVPSRLDRKWSLFALTRRYDHMLLMLTFSCSSNQQSMWNLRPWQNQSSAQTHPLAF